MIGSSTNLCQDDSSNGGHADGSNGTSNVGSSTLVRSDGWGDGAGGGWLDGGRGDGASGSCGDGWDSWLWWCDGDSGEDGGWDTGGDGQNRGAVGILSLQERHHVSPEISTGNRAGVHTEAAPARAATTARENFILTVGGGLGCLCVE